MQDKLSVTYNDAVQKIKQAILESQWRATQHINEEQLALYYGIGKFISQHTRTGVWGTNAIDTISRQLSAELPGLKGYSATNLRLMRLFYEAWSDLFNSSAKADELRGNNSSAAADKLLRGDGDNPTVGLLICKTAKNTIVEWSLQDINKPLGVATYQLEEVVERTVKEIEMRNP